MKKHTVEEDVYILAIESSCDETAAAVLLGYAWTPEEQKEE